MPSGPFAESESRFNSKLSTLSEGNDTESREKRSLVRSTRLPSSTFLCHIVPYFYTTRRCTMNREISVEDHRANTLGSTSGSNGESTVGTGGSPSDRGDMVGSPEEKESGPGT